MWYKHTCESDWWGRCLCHEETLQELDPGNLPPKIRITNKIYILIWLNLIWFNQEISNLKYLKGHSRKHCNAMYPCSTKTREVLGNPSPPPSRFPSTLEILGLGKSFGRRGWISQYLPRLGGARIYSPPPYFVSEWVVGGWYSKILNRGYFLLAEK